jgi:hypothetical protein
MLNYWQGCPFCGAGLLHIGRASLTIGDYFCGKCRRWYNEPRSSDNDGALETSEEISEDLEHIRSQADEKGS